MDQTAKITVIGFGLALTILVMLAVLSYQNTRAQIQNSEKVRHTLQVIDELEATLVAINNLQSAQGGHILTSQENFLVEFNDATVDLNQRIKNLRQMTSDNINQQMRAPLGSIDGFSQALLEDYVDKLDRDGQDYLHRVRAAGQRMAQLIDDLLNLSRVTRSRIERTSVKISALAQEVVLDLQRL